MKSASSRLDSTITSASTNMTSAHQNSLDLVKSRAVIDIDQLSPTIAETLGPFCDMTSNQALIAGVVTADPDGKLVTSIVEGLKKDGKTGEEGVEEALDLLVSLFLSDVI
jgi:hypothetical protein